MPKLFTLYLPICNTYDPLARLIIRFGRHAQGCGSPEIVGGSIGRGAFQ